MDRQSGLLGGSAVPPRRGEITTRFEAPDPSVYVTNPGSTNPAPDDLRYRVLPEAEDRATQITTRLTEFSELPDANTPGVRVLNLSGVLRQSQLTAREHLSAEEDYILASIRLLIERHLWTPRLFNDTSLGFSGGQGGGSPEAAMSVINQLRATQRLPFGGEVEARWVWEASENLRNNVDGRYQQASRLVLGGQVPLLRGAGNVAREDLIQAERDLVYSARSFERFRREFLVSIARDYFALLLAQAQIENSRQRVESARALQREQQAKFDAGRVNRSEVSIAENNVLSAQAQLSQQIDRYVFALDRFKIRLGLTPEDRVVIVPTTLDIPATADTASQAVAAALSFRLDLQTRQDRLLDSRRSIEVARNRLLPELALAGDVTLRTDPTKDDGGIVFDLDDTLYSASLTLGLPLDREIERLNLRSSIIAFERAVRDLESFRDNVIVEARTSLRNIELQRFNLLLAEQRVRTVEDRQLEQEIKRDQTTAQQRVDTQNDLINARNARDQAASDLRIAVLDYLLTTGQMRVARDGTFIELPGMNEFANGAAGGAQDVPVVPAVPLIIPPAIDPVPDNNPANNPANNTGNSAMNNATSNVTSTTAG